MPSSLVCFFMHLEAMSAHDAVDGMTAPGTCPARAGAPAWWGDRMRELEEAEGGGQEEPTAIRQALEVRP